MAGKRGRPSRNGPSVDAWKEICEATVRIMREKGADSVTVRSVCEEAGLSIGTFYHHFQNKDDLMMYFIREESFDAFSLQEPLEHLPQRICELYMHLIDRYMEFGKDFMKSFYNTGNKALSAYMGVVDGRFAEGTVMARCEAEAALALQKGILKEGTDVHQLSADICTIVKGCVFEWSLEDGHMDLPCTMERLIGALCREYMAKP